MTIETKFEPYQSVWAMQDNSPICRQIDNVRIKAYWSTSEKRNVAETTYDLNATKGTFTESELFKSKADLLNSL